LNFTCGNKFTQATLLIIYISFNSISYFVILVNPKMKNSESIPLSTAVVRFSQHRNNNLFINHRSDLKMPKHLNQFKETVGKIKTICEEVFEELGPGFDESDYQMAMSLEFGKSNEFEAIREISVELFYKDQYLKFGELDFLIAPKPQSAGYPLPFFLETKVINSEDISSYDQIRRYLMSLPKNSSSIINEIEIAVLVIFQKNSELIKGEVLEKEGNKIISRGPSSIDKPTSKVLISCFYYDKKEKKIEAIDGIN
tara:strand:+ start:8672 stop:9436 length:765 start_codon:yes stop_codon:yes gene_type:complete